MADAAGFSAFTSRRCVIVIAISRNRSAALALAFISSTIWPLLAAWLKVSQSYSMTDMALMSSACSNSLTRDFLALRHVRHIDDEVRLGVVLARRLEQIDDVLGVAQVGEIWNGRDDHFIGLQQHALGPRRPAVRQIDGDVGHVLAHDIDDHFAGLQARCRSRDRARPGPQRSTNAPSTWSASGRATGRRDVQVPRALRRCPAPGPD